MERRSLSCRFCSSRKGRSEEARYGQPSLPEGAHRNVSPSSETQSREAGAGTEAATTVPSELMSTGFAPVEYSATCTHGKLALLREFSDRADALEAAGLTGPWRRLRSRMRDRARQRATHAESESGS